MREILCLAVVLQVAAGTDLLARPAAAASITEFSPQGEVKGVRQVKARFSEPMIALGDPRAGVDPFEIDCSEVGSARWVDSVNWVYDFGRDLPGGVVCSFRLREGLRTLEGAPVAGQKKFGFSTGGPAILRSYPFEGASQIEEDQAFVLALDTEPDPESLLRTVGFQVEGLPGRVDVRLIEGELRDEVLALAPSWLPQENRIVLQARQSFPTGTRLSLVWGPGVTSRTGVAGRQGQVLPFTTRNAFTATFSCTRENPRFPCHPITDMRLAFSAPVRKELALRIVMVGADGKKRTAGDEDEDEPDDWNFVHGVDFRGPFPEDAKFRIELPDDLRDEADRPLENADRFPLTVRTGPYPPLAKFSSRFGIIEWNAEPTLPVTLRNLEPEVRMRLLSVDAGSGEGFGKSVAELVETAIGKVLRVAPDREEEILPWLRRVAFARREESIFAGLEAEAVETLSLPKPNGASAFEVVGIPFRAPGLYVVEIESPRLGASLLGKPAPMFVPTAALVTNLAVHLKRGRAGSLVWVTTLDEAKPVDGAEVAVRDCHGELLWSGTTDAEGIVRVAGLPAEGELPVCRESSAARFPFYDVPLIQALRWLDTGLLVTARVGADLGFVHSSWDDGIEPWRFGLPAGASAEPVVARTVLDRSLLRAGDTLHMKHVLRNRALRGFAPVDAKERPTTVSIRHLGSDETYEMPLEWAGHGVSESAWKIPRGAKLGRYDIVLMGPPVAEETPGGVARRTEWASGSFRVEEFRVPLLAATVKLPAGPQVAVSEVPVNLAVRYLAGGGASRLGVTLRSVIRPVKLPAFEGFEGFAFANGDVEEGVTRSEEENDGETRPSVHQRASLELDAAGTARTAITGLPVVPVARELLVELEFRDPNGEGQTVAATVPLWPAARLVGLKPDSWVATKKSVKARVAVVDLSGKPLAGAPVVVDVFERRFYSHRKRIVGGFYAYEHVAEAVRVGELCRGTTDPKGLFACEGPAPRDGNLILRASAAEGDAVPAHADVWVAESEQWWFRTEDSDRIDVLPEKRRYEPGETARFQVRMPFRRATALVTLEREGILDARVVTLSGAEPVVEVPVTEDLAPNLFVSVLAVRGRVGGVRPTALIDLGKPAFRVGVAEIEVGWQAHGLDVRVAPEREVYRVRERARVDVSVRTTNGDPLPADAEVAIAAVDEGLLELLPNDSWKLLEAMMGRRAYGVMTATAQMQVVGKRHYGIKALSTGGGGGQQPTRELFDTLLLWKGRVPLDAGGRAVVEVPLNDSLTSFRIVAVATGGTGRFGTGAATIRSTQDLILLPGIAPLAREEDRIRPEVTVRNTTSSSMEVTIRGMVEGLGHGLAGQKVVVAGGEAKVVGWDVVVPAGVTTLGYEFIATSADHEDRLRVTQGVLPAVPVRTLQATLARWEGPLRLPVAPPGDAIPGRGGVRVTLSPSLAGSLEGVREHMARYPYTCLEQRVSKAVALDDRALWQEVAASLPAHLDGDGLLKFFPTMPWGSEVLTAYVLAVASEAGLDLPASVLERTRAGLGAFVEGRIARRSSLQTADLSIRKIAALEALSRFGEIDPALLGSVRIEPNLWPTSAVLDWWSLLRRASAIPGREARLTEANQIVRSRLNLQGTTMGFSTETRDCMSWLMVCPDTNVARLALHLVESGEWTDDVPRIVRGVLGRQRRGHWDCTTTNAWGALAVRKFAAAFEAEAVSGATAASFGDERHDIAWEDPPVAANVLLPWPAGASTLEVDHAGQGRPWVLAESRAAVPLREAFSSGYRVERTLIPVEQREPGRWSRGDVLRVRLEVDAQSDMTWVVVDDPVPAGASHLGTGLGRDSSVLAGEPAEGDWDDLPTFEERRFDSFRAYYDFVPKGKLSLEYVIRVNQSGAFHLPPTRVEALYAPEMFGEIPNGPIEVQP